MKEIIYDGFVELILVDPSISGSVFDFLLPHFLRFFKEVTTTYRSLLLKFTRLLNISLLCCHFISNILNGHHFHLSPHLISISGCRNST